jgi:hypothetical protein
MGICCCLLDPRTNSHPAKLLLIEARIVGDSDTGRAQEIVGLLPDRVIRSGEHEARKSDWPALRALPRARSTLRSYHALLSLAQSLLLCFMSFGACHAQLGHDFRAAD